MVFDKLFNKKKGNPAYHESIDRTRYALLEDWIKKLETGDLSALRVVYSVFAEKDTELMKRAGEAIRQQLSPMTKLQLLRLCERFRTFTSLEWYIDWSLVQLASIKNTIPGMIYQYVLILGSFHPNGYFREKCIRDMKGRKDMLFWLFPRVNDWVLPIREAAVRILESSLADCEGEELISCLPAYERLKNCRRRTETQMQNLEEQLHTKLLQLLKEIKPDKIFCMEPAVRTSLYRTATQAGLWTLPEMETYLNQEKLSCLKRILIRRILIHPDCTLEWAEHYLTDRSSQVRRMAVEFRYERLKTGWDGLETMLLDKNRGVREYAVYILERHSSLDIRAYYIEHLEDASPESAILGLSEYSQQGNVPLLLKCLQRPERRILKCTLLALGELEDFTDETLLWNYLLDDRNDISKAAYLSIKKRDFYPGAASIYIALSQAEAEHQKRYLLNLLLRENTWERLPYLLRLYRQDLPEYTKSLLLSGILCRSMYTRVPRRLQNEILLALEEKKGKIPKWLVDGILYDMKFVAK